jgi:hypothetical protein
MGQYYHTTMARAEAVTYEGQQLTDSLPDSGLVLLETEVLRLENRKGWNSRGSSIFVLFLQWCL